MTNLQRDERAAMTGDRSAIVRLVSAVREFRTAAAKLTERRYSDGACDGVAVGEFVNAVEEIELAHREDGE